MKIFENKGAVAWKPCIVHQAGEAVPLPQPHPDHRCGSCQTKEGVAELHYHALTVREKTVGAKATRAVGK